MCISTAEKKWGEFTGESCKCTPGIARVEFYEESGEIWEWLTSSFRLCC